MHGQSITSIVKITIPINLAIPASGQSMNGQLLSGIVMPAAWTAANITFQATYDIDAATPVWNDLYDESGNEVTVVAAAARFIRLNPTDFAGISGLKVRSGTTGTPVNQAAARDVFLVFRMI